MAHNTLTFDDRLQQVNGYAKPDQTFENEKIMFAVSNLTDVYKDQVEEVKRGLAIVDRNYVVIRDEIKTLSKNTKIRWNMLSGTNISIQSDKIAVLRAKSGKELLMRIDSPSDAKIHIRSTQPPNDWDKPNGENLFVGFDCDAPANTPVVLQVSLIPVTGKENKYQFNIPLDEWKRDKYQF
jgi:hypothetical protein